MSWWDIIKIAPHEQTIASRLEDKQLHQDTINNVNQEYGELKWLETPWRGDGDGMSGYLLHNGFYLNVVEVWEGYGIKRIIPASAIDRIKSDMDELLSLDFHLYPKAVGWDENKPQDYIMNKYLGINSRRFNGSFITDNWEKRPIKYFIDVVKTFDKVNAIVPNKVDFWEQDYIIGNSSRLSKLEYYFPDFHSQRKFIYKGESVDQIVKQHNIQEAANKRAQGFSDSIIDEYSNVYRVSNHDMKQLISSMRNNNLNHKIESFIAILGLSGWLKIEGQVTTYYINITRPYVKEDGGVCSVAMFDIMNNWYCTGTNPKYPVPFNDYIASLISITASADNTQQFQEQVIRQ